jgi:hypothetical protein
MKDERTIEPNKIHLVKLQTIKGTIDTAVNAPNIQVQEHAFNFDVSIGIKAEDKVIGIIFKVDIQALGPNKTKLGLTASYTHELVFEIDNLDDFIDIQEQGQEPKVDRLMLGTLLGISYSTVRGIVFTRTQGTALTTALTGVVMPVVDPKNFIKKEEEPLQQEQNP